MLGPRAVAFLATGAVALFAAGCGGGDNGSSDTGSGSSSQSTQTQTQTQSSQSSSSGASGGASASAGKQVFTSVGCASCHTLSDANASGQVGPNLDQLKPDKATVARQVRNGGGRMPAFKDRLSAQQINAVATYVASVAGK